MSDVQVESLVAYMKGAGYSDRQIARALKRKEQAEKKFGERMVRELEQDKAFKLEARKRQLRLCSQLMLILDLAHVIAPVTRYHIECKALQIARASRAVFVLKAQNDAYDLDFVDIKLGLQPGFCRLGKGEQPLGMLEATDCIPPRIDFEDPFLCPHCADIALGMMARKEVSWDPLGPARAQMESK